MVKMTWFTGKVLRKRKRSIDGVEAWASDPPRYDRLLADAVRTGAVFKGSDPDVERGPPAKPTTVSFSHHLGREPIDWSDEQPPPDLQALFSKVVRPADVNRRHLEALNIESAPACPLEDLLPKAEDASSWLPSFPTAAPVIKSSYASVTKSDSSASKKRKDYDDRLTELRFDNDDAFRAIARTFKDGVKPPRLAYMRKFWEGLESMSQYWDCSLDEYYESRDSDICDGNDQKPKRARLGPVSAKAEEELGGSHLPKSKHHHQDHNPHDSPVEEAEHEQAKSDETNETTSPSGASANLRNDRTIPISRPSTPPPTRMRYKGRRTASGRDMPDAFRTDTVRAFVEAACWPFQISLHPPRRVPLVQLNKLNVPVRMSSVVSRVPGDRTRFRQGWLEGPFIGVQVRADTEFVDDTGEPLLWKSGLDQLREIGGLLELAQERRRESKTEVRPGEGQWWTEKPRWGGGPGGAMDDEDTSNPSSSNSEIVAAVEQAIDAAKAEMKTDEKSANIARKRKTPELLWKELKCGSPRWDPKMEYKAIGKQPGSSYDEVCYYLYHHISFKLADSPTRSSWSPPSTTTSASLSLRSTTLIWSS